MSFVKILKSRKLITFTLIAPTVNTFNINKPSHFDMVSDGVIMALELSLLSEGFINNTTIYDSTSTEGT